MTCKTNIIIAPFDACARTGGPAQSVRAWRELLGDGYPYTLLSREQGLILPLLLERNIQKTIRESKVPLVLGGDHSLTYNVLKALTSKLGEVTVVHFDAHHDAYQGKSLNHYTVFSFVTRRLPVKLVGVGYRHDCEPISGILPIQIHGPTYISLDVDFFSPILVASVGDPIRCIEGIECNFEAFARSLSMIKGEIVGADIVEWCGDVASSHERIFIKKVFDLLLERLNNVEVHTN